MRTKPSLARTASASLGLALMVGVVCLPIVASADEPLVAEKIALEQVDRPAFDKLVAEHRGKVVLVDFWATWCVPCVKQFPHTVELARKHRGAGLVVVAVSFDEADQEAAVRKFLAEKGARFTNLQVKGDVQEAIDSFDLDNGALPNYWLYDRAGKIARRFAPSDPTVKFRPADIDAAVEELLAQPKPK